MSAPDPFEHADAAYVLHLLSESERAEFEAHLQTCDACAERVRQLQLPATLLATLDADELLAASEDPAGPMPDTLLPGLLKRAGVRHRRQRWITTGLSGLVAACLIALAVLVWPSGGAAPAHQPLTMAAVAATPLRATADISSQPWGTKISLDCDYIGYPSAPAGGWAYNLKVIAKDGTAQDLGTWRVASSAHTRFSSGTQLPRSAIRTVQITTPSGTPVLSLNL
jgi:hypothetical protein